MCRRLLCSGGALHIGTRSVRVWFTWVNPSTNPFDNIRVSTVFLCARYITSGKRPRLRNSILYYHHRYYLVAAAPVPVFGLIFWLEHAFRLERKDEVRTSIQRINAFKTKTLYAFKTQIKFIFSYHLWFYLCNIRTHMCAHVYKLIIFLQYRPLTNNIYIYIFLYNTYR